MSEGAQRTEEDIDRALALLAPVWHTPLESALLFDFDGTLAPIVDDPPSARPVAAALPSLRALSERLGAVAIISGRPLEFLMQVLPDMADVTLVGQYGLQHLSRGRIILDPRVEPYRDATARIASLAEEQLPGVFVERKEGISVALHWRTTPSMEQRCREVAGQLGDRFGFDVLDGRMSAELHPPIGLDKGTVAAELASTATFAAYFGDDLGDVPAFSALRELTSSGRLRRSACIAIANQESPRELLDAAQAFLPDPATVSLVLERLLDLVTAGRSGV